MKTLKKIFNKKSGENNLKSRIENGAMIYAQHVQADRKLLYYQVAFEIGLMMGIAEYFFALISSH